MFKFQNFAAAILLTLVFCLNSLAQPAQAGRANNRPGREVAVTETFEPSFSIEPLAIQVEGRPNEVVPFQFTIRSANRTANIEVKPIGLRQELSGQILHNDQASATEHIRMLSQSNLQLRQDEPAKIEGVIRIPQSDARHHSFGILVRDIGVATKNSTALKPDGTPKTEANIQFVTQYVLRIDVQVVNVRGEQIQKLAFSSVEMVPADGRPRLQLLVENPTETTFEFEMRAKLRSSPSDRSMKPLRLAMPIRSDMESEQRFVGRILGNSKVRMQELLPEAIAGGDYEVDIELLSDDRVVKRSTVKVHVDAQDYPAQEVLIAQVGEFTQVSPSQVELSQLRGGARRVTVLLKNRSTKETNTIHLKAQTADGLELSSISIQPDQITLAPNGSRKISMTLKGQPDAEQAAIYGNLSVQVKSGSKDFEESRKLPLAVLLKKSAHSSATMLPLQWNGTGKHPAFETIVENTSTTHLPLNARLAIIDEAGRKISVPAGFGRWLMPGEKTKLAFRVDKPLLPGKYMLRCELALEDKPLLVEQSFVVSDFDNPQHISRKVEMSDVQDQS